MTTETLEQIALRIARELNTTGKGLIDQGAAIEFARRLTAELSKQEPVAWWRYEGDLPKKFDKGWFQRGKPERNGIPLYVAPPPLFPADHVAVPKGNSEGGWKLDFGWLKKVKAVLRSTPDWEDCQIDLEEIEAVALAMLAAAGEGRGSE